MNPDESSEPTTAELLALRQQSDAVRLITERLKVKEMGPADHIRTKHEVKAFVQAGAEAEAETLLQRSTRRRTLGQKISQDMAQRQRQSP